MIYKTVYEMDDYEREIVIGILRYNAKQRVNNPYQDVSLNSIFI